MGERKRKFVEKYDPHKKFQKMTVRKRKGVNFQKAQRMINLQQKTMWT